MSKFSIGGGSPPKKTPNSGVVDLAAARILQQEQDLASLAQKMQLEGRAPEAIMGALFDENARFPTPLPEEHLDALVSKTIDAYRKSYAPRLIKVPMDGFMGKAFPPPRFIVDLLIPRNEVTLGGGHGGSGKSILFLALAAHVASGTGWDRFDVEQGPVLFVSLEDQASHVMHRLQKIIRDYLLDPNKVEQNLHIVDGSASPELMVEFNEHGTHSLLPTATMRELEAIIAETRPKLIIIDNASDAFGGNENTRRDVRTFIRHLAAIARTNNAAVVLLAHIDKAAARNGANGNSYSGSTAWHNSTRSRLAIVETEGQIHLHHEKHNHSQRADPVPLSWTADGVLMPGKSSLADSARSEKARDDANGALLAMRAAQQRRIQVTTAASGNATSWHALDHFSEMETFRAGDGKRRFHAALLALERDHLLARKEYRNDQRKRREAWELTAAGEAAAERLAP